METIDGLGIITSREIILSTIERHFYSIIHFEKISFETHFGLYFFLFFFLFLLFF